MNLLERSHELNELGLAFQQVLAGNGRTVFISGEAGMGKTALVRKFIADITTPHLLLKAYCDSLFAARPLGPLFDVASWLGEDFVSLLKNNPDRSQIFSSALEAIEAQGKPVIFFIEDIHWADTASLDFVRFLARRITQLQCLFVLTLRENELPDAHPYRLILGELPPTDFQKLVLVPLSRTTVGQLATEAGRDGEEIFQLTAGIPYYVREVLSSYHRGIPESVRDSILSLYHRQSDHTRNLWETLSVIPGRVDNAVMQIIFPTSSKVVDFCFRAGVLVHDGVSIAFKHELFRTSIEESLSPFRRVELHQVVLEAMLKSKGTDLPAARIIHHARLAHDAKRLQELAPKAASEASTLGSHLEAAKFYKLALDHSEGCSANQLAETYMKYSYECYLTNQINEAIRAAEQAAEYWPDTERIQKGNTYRVMSRLHWIDGDREKAERFGQEAITLCEKEPQSRELALAYSNMSQLMMLKDDKEQCLQWGAKAVDLARTLHDEEVLCHSYNNTGTALLRNTQRAEDGEHFLRESLRLALQHGFDEHAARAYANLGSSHLERKNYPAAESILAEGIQYCDARNLYSWMYAMQSRLVLHALDTGQWDYAEQMSERLLQRPGLPSSVLITLYTTLATIRLRRSESTIAGLLEPAIRDAMKVGDLQKLAPVARLLLEHAWISGTAPEYPHVLLHCAEMIQHKARVPEDLAFWWWKAVDYLPDYLQKCFQPNAEEQQHNLSQSKEDNPYLHALWLAEGDAGDQRAALLELKGLGAVRTAQRIETQMKEQGIERIPRGPRASTRNNPAGLTNRQMHVLELLSAGLQNKEIASELFLSDKTVDHHISAILAKLDVPTRVKAVAKAKELGVLK